LVFTEDRSAGYINDLINQTTEGIPVKSLTMDNDLSFQKHEKLSELIGAIVFFRHPYARMKKELLKTEIRQSEDMLQKK